MADQIDIHIGKRLKELRESLGIVQTDIGNTLGVTFQQVQKYERGVNRISAVMLYHLAHMFEVDMNYFFEGYKQNLKRPKNLEDDEEMSKIEIVNLVKSYKKIRYKKVRKKVFGLIDAIGKYEEQK